MSGPQAKTRWSVNRRTLGEAGCAMVPSIVRSDSLSAWWKLRCPGFAINSFPRSMSRAKTRKQKRPRENACSFAEAKHPSSKCKATLQWLKDGCVDGDYFPGWCTHKYQHHSQFLTTLRLNEATKTFSLAVFTTHSLTLFLSQCPERVCT